MRGTLLVLAALLALIASPSAAHSPFDGIWLFDAASEYPGITMMEVTSAAGRIVGEPTTQWYGPIDFKNARPGRWAALVRSAI